MKVDKYDLFLSDGNVLIGALYDGKITDGGLLGASGHSWFHGGKIYVFSSDFIKDIKKDGISVDIDTELSSCK